MEHRLRLDGEEFLALARVIAEGAEAVAGVRRDGIFRLGRAGLFSRN